MAKQASLLARAYLEALRAADAAGAYRVVVRARERGMRLLDLYEWVITPAMHEVGRLWEQGAVTVADEHLASELTYRVLAALRPSGLREKQDVTTEKPRAMLAAVQGEQHALGLRMAADLLEDAGYQAIYLGADVPTEGLLDAAKAFSPDLLGLSVTMPERRSALEEAVARVRRARPRLDLLVGGQASAPLRMRGATTVKDLISLEERLRKRCAG